MIVRGAPHLLVVVAEVDDELIRARGQRLEDSLVSGEPTGGLDAGRN
jgi:hypothetical protein